jgi:5-(carboxyamino)imidazole ribonucleotide mutase
MPKVGVIMGSDSDLPVMQGALDILERFAVDYTVTICSALRLPLETAQCASGAADQGYEVLIAAAGGAAHLPGVIAAYTILPVIGVPVKSGALQGVDALYAIVQMPKGIPVATVAIDGSANAALLALEILALKYGQLRQALLDYRRGLAGEVLHKDAKLQELGYKAYLEK